MARVWAATAVVDYVTLVCFCSLIHVIHRGEGKYDDPSLALAMAVQGAGATLLLYFRERLHFAILAQRIAHEKRKDELTTRTLRYVFQTYATSMVSFFLMCRWEIVWYTPYELSWSFWAQSFLPFYTILLLRDICFLAPFHHLMHQKQFYFLHKTHHEVTKNAQALHAFHIDTVDLILENAGAPFLLFAVQYCAGWRVGFHWMVPILLTTHDGALHSVNPYSVMYFNPILDHFWRPNVHHQLHHALNRGYLLFVPYHHVFAAQRKLDTDEYNRVFKTAFEF